MALRHAATELSRGNGVSKKPKRIPRARVSDHAVLRYLENAEGLDVEHFRRKIGRLCAAAVAMGATSLYHEGLTFQFRLGGVTTVLGPGERASNAANWHKITEMTEVREARERVRRG